MARFTPVIHAQTGEKFHVNLEQVVCVQELDRNRGVVHLVGGMHIPVAADELEALARLLEERGH